MLDPYYLEHITDAFMRNYERAVLCIIEDAARRIVNTGEVTDTAAWQIQKAEQVGAYHNFVLSELSKATTLSQAELLELFEEAALRTLASDDRIYHAKGYETIPLKDNPFMQGIIWSAYERTKGEMRNLTRTTANTATQQFERILDQVHLNLSSGAFSYQDVIKQGVRALSEKGIASIRYPTGRVDYTDVAFRRATLTGLNQAGAKLQERRMQEVGVGYAETTAHAGARNTGTGAMNHASWQGRVFKLVGSTPEYPNFYDETGYGTGEGLCGWHCRHGFYPAFPGASETAYTNAELYKLNNRTVTYNGKEIDLYKATQLQRKNERQIRRWKREAAGLGAAGLDTAEATAKVRDGQAEQRDFIKQTGLHRDYFRERAGKQNH